MSADPAPGSRPGPLAPGSTAAEFEESPAVKIARLERALADQRRFSRRMGRQLHSRLRGELRDAERRAEAAEAELEQLRASATWRAGRIVLAVPRRLRRLRPPVS